MATKVPRSAECWRYVPIADRELPVEQRSTFVLRPLTQLERADAQDNMVRIHTVPGGGRVTTQRDHRLSIEICLANIASVENCPAGAPEPWPDDATARAGYLNMLDDGLVQEIGNEIYAHSMLGGPEKNS